MSIHHTLFAQRRARLAAQLGPGGIAIVPTAPEQPRNRDSDFLYRHDSYFYYLTGFTEPNAWLVITGEGESTLFCNPKDAEREVWDGIRLGPAAAPDALGVQASFSVAELDQRLPKLLENRSVVWYPFATHPGLDARINGWLQPVRARVRYGALCPEQQRDLCGPLDEMRLIKDAHEQTWLVPLLRAVDNPRGRLSVAFSWDSQDNPQIGVDPRYADLWLQSARVWDLIDHHTSTLGAVFSQAFDAETDAFLLGYTLDCLAINYRVNNAVFRLLDGARPGWLDQSTASWMLNATVDLFKYRAFLDAQKKTAS